MTYEEERELLKYGKWKSIFFFWSSVDPIVAFTLHGPMNNVGGVFGLGLNALVNFLTVCGVGLFNDVADMIEECSLDDKRVTSVQGIFCGDFFAWNFFPYNFFFLRVGI